MRLGAPGRIPVDVDDGPALALLFAGHVTPPTGRHGPKGVGFGEGSP